MTNGETTQPIQPEALKKILIDLCTFAMIEETPDPVAPYCYDYLNKHGETLKASASHEFKADCSKGCAHCCHLPIMCPAQLSFYVAKKLREDWSENQLRPLKESLKSASAQYQQNRGPNILNLRVPCPFLDQDNACRIYEMRPFSCRSFLSEAQQACQALIEHAQDNARSVEQDPTVFTLYQAATTALVAANKKQNRTDQQVFFLPAVYAALLDPTLETRWLAGEPLSEMGLIV